MCPTTRRLNRCRGDLRKRPFSGPGIGYLSGLRVPDRLRAEPVSWRRTGGGCSVRHREVTFRSVSGGKEAGWRDDGCEPCERRPDTLPMSGMWITGEQLQSRPAEALLGTVPLPRPGRVWGTPQTAALRAGCPSGATVPVPSLQQNTKEAWVNGQSEAPTCP